MRDFIKERQAYENGVCLNKEMLKASERNFVSNDILTKIKYILYYGDLDY